MRVSTFSKLCHTAYSLHESLFVGSFASFDVTCVVLIPDHGAGDAAAPHHPAVAEVERLLAAEHAPQAHSAVVAMPSVPAVVGNH